MKPLCITLLCLALGSLFAQVKPDSLLFRDTLVLMNGDLLPTRILDTLPETIYCLHPKPTKKAPERKLLMDRDRVFSVKYSGGAERIFYSYDTMAGNFFTVPEMRNFVNGEQDADKYHGTKAEFWIGLGIGLGSGAILPHYGGYFYSYLPAFAYTSAMLIPIIKVRAPNYKSRCQPHPDVYLMGYERIARKKKIVSGLKGTVVGLAAGSLIFFFVPDSFYQKNL